MAYISFEHKNNIPNKLKRNAYALGSGGDYIHCEIVLDQYGQKVCSSWFPKGVEIREWNRKIKAHNWTNYYLGDVDYLLLDFFKDKVGTEYTVRGLAFNMMLNGNFNSDKAFCSQICYDALRNLEVYNLPTLVSSSISPNDLEILIKEHNFSIIK